MTKHIIDPASLCLSVCLSIRPSLFLCVRPSVRPSVSLSLSLDSVVNNYGKLLLNLCTTFYLCILNGVCKGDFQGCYTYISETGSSVNDYFILSYDLYALIHSTSVNFVSQDVLNRITCHLHSVLYFQRKM